MQIKEVHSSPEGDKGKFVDNQAYKLVFTAPEPGGYYFQRSALELNCLGLSPEPNLCHLYPPLHFNMGVRAASRGCHEDHRASFANTRAEPHNSSFTLLLPPQVLPHTLICHKGKWKALISVPALRRRPWLSQPHTF